MPECLPDLPRIIRQCSDGWEGADHPDGPWRPIPAPQAGLPWQAGEPAPEGKAPATISAADRLALVVCVAVLPGAKPCKAPCNNCRVNSAAVARELAVIAREDPEGRVAAEWLDGVAQ